MSDLLEVEGLELTIDYFRVLEGVELSVEEEEVVALLGENGAGKTMTLRSIAGLEEASSERLALGGNELGDLEPHSRVEFGLSYCPSEENVFPDMSVRENLETGKYLYPEELESGIGRAYELFPALKKREGQLAKELSGGERRMLALGKSLMTNPVLLLLDEFSLGLSREIVFDFVDRVRTINRSGVAILFVEQNFTLAGNLAEREYYMVEGRMVGRDELSP